MTPCPNCGGRDRHYDARCLVPKPILWEPSMEWVRDMAEDWARQGIGKETTVNAITHFVCHAGVPWEPRHRWAVEGLAGVAYDRVMAGVGR